MSSNLVMLPIVIPMVTGILSLLVAPSYRIRRVVGIAGLLINLAMAMLICSRVLGAGGQILVLQAADWPAPFGITVVIDALSAVFLLTGALAFLAIYLYCDEQLHDTAGGLFHPLFHLLVLGVQWSLITGDLFNLFVAFEIMLMASYALLVLGTSRRQMRQAYKYVVINLFGSTLFVTCCGLIYGHVGTLNLADLARLSHSGLIPPAAVPAITVLLLVFGIKAAIFPLWFWLPDSYPTAPAGLGALLGGILTKIGVYVMIRIFVMVFGPSTSQVSEVLRPLLMATAGITMFLGVLGAVSMTSVRRILSIHIISQVGYMVLAVGLGIGIGLTTENRMLAVAGGIFFILHNMIVKSSLFLCGGLMKYHAGSDELERMGGLAKQAPWLATFFFIAALSLAGLPPLSGFFAKFLLVREAFRAGWYTLTFIALATSVLTLLSMIKIWSYAFWSRPDPQRQKPSAPHDHGIVQAMIGTGILVTAAVVMGLAAEPVLQSVRSAARTAVDPAPYIQAVLGQNQVYPLKLADQSLHQEDHQP